MDVAEIGVLAGAAAVALIALVLALRATRQNQGDNRLALVAETAAKLAESQALLTGRLSQMAEGQSAAQARMGEQLQAQERAVTKMLEERLTDVTRRIGENLQKTSDKSAETMGLLQERLAVIDAAQKNITELSAEFVTLQDILSNKQARGAIGQTQMEDLVRNMLPPGAFDFQVTLSNGKRADCVIRLPNPPGLIAVDSKYPHEAFMLLMAAADDRERAVAEQAFRSDVIKHIRDIADKYIIPGETADSAIMFVPAESVFAELHDRFPMVVEEGFRRRVYIVSPTTLMATLNTIRTILKDARMREQAHIIQSEIGKMMEDVVRLDKRVGQLATHFEQTQKDVNEIRTSTTKIIKRGVAIENIPLEAPTIEGAERLPAEDETQPPRLQ
jgi:DNA recombination protein RmuC